MNSAITKTISFLLLIAIGYFLQKKIQGRERKDGIKTLILSLALPATIFIALLKIEFSWGMIIVPVLALGFNLLMYLLVSKLPLPSLFNLKEEQYRTLIMLLPSLAPGLSLFPFIMEYHGEEPLALAALADVGNKVFVLIILYSIAMKWYFDRNEIGNRNTSEKLKSLFKSMLEEPVNMVMLAAIVMLAFGLHFDSLPGFLRDSVDKMSLMMTPLILLFIGISIKFTWQQVKAIFSFLFFRSAIAFVISGLLLVLLPVTDVPTMILIVVFPQSACSFWPFAHMSAVNTLESAQENPIRPRTFDLDFGMNALACSLPFSVALILSVYVFEDFFVQPANVFLSSGIFIALAALPLLFSARWFKTYASRLAEERS